MPAHAGLLARDATARRVAWRAYGLRRCRSRGNRVTCRTLAAPVSRAVQRSSPIAKPPCGGIPCSNTCRYPAYGPRVLAPLGQRGQVVGVPVQPLPAGDQLEAAEDQVEAVGVAGPGRVGVGVERPLGHRVAGDEQELRPVLAQRPVAEPPLVRRATRSGSPRGSHPACAAISSCASAKWISGICARDHGRGQPEQVERAAGPARPRRPPSRRSRRAAPPSRRGGR